MNLTWKVLAPVDSRRLSGESVEYAISVAAALSAELDFLDVNDAAAGDANGGDESPAAAMVGDAFVRIRRVPAEGTPAATIVKHAEAVNANVVLMTSSRYGKWNRFWRKSLTGDVLDLSPRPVWLTHQKQVDPDYRFRGRRILCAVGLDGTDKEFLRHAEEFARRAQAELVLLHVLPPVSEGLLYQSLYPGGRPLADEVATSGIATLANDLSVPAITSVVTGVPERCIIHAARSHSADLVLISRTCNGIPGAYDGCIESVLAGVFCPVVAIPVRTASGRPSSINSQIDTLGRKNRANEPLEAPGSDLANR